MLALAFAGCSGPTTSSEPLEPYAFRTALSTNAIFIGEPVLLTMETAHPTNTQVRLPDLARERDVIVRDLQQETRTESDELAHTMVSILFTSMRPGRHVLNSNDVVFATEGAEPITRPFPFVAYNVESSLTGESEARGVKPIHEWPGRVPTWIIALAGIGILAFLIGSVVAWRMRRPAIAYAPPLPPAHVSALEAIERLRKKDYIGQGKLDPFYIELSDIVRLYLERRFDVHAPEQTTEEFIRAAAESHLLSRQHQDVTHQFLEQCDLVKFAQARPGVTEMESALAAGETLVVETAATEELAA